MRIVVYINTIGKSYIFCPIKIFMGNKCLIEVVYRCYEWQNRENGWFILESDAIPELGLFTFPHDYCADEENCKKMPLPPHGCRNYLYSQSCDEETTCNYQIIRQILPYTEEDAKRLKAKLLDRSEMEKMTIPRKKPRTLEEFLKMDLKSLRVIPPNIEILEHIQKLIRFERDVKEIKNFGEIREFPCENCFKAGVYVYAIPISGFGKIQTQKEYGKVCLNCFAFEISDSGVYQEWRPWPSGTGPNSDFNPYK